MCNPDFEDWLSERIPPVPPVFLLYLLQGGEVGTEAARLAERGADALCRALERPGRRRDAAFFLLTADALLTYACEAAAGAEDVLGNLEEVLQTLVGRFR